MITGVIPVSVVVKLRDPLSVDSFKLTSTSAGSTFKVGDEPWIETNHQFFTGITDRQFNS